MKVFILEDDVNCNPVIEWIGKKFEVEYAQCIEDAVCYLEYEEGSEQCDKYIFDASVPAAEIIHSDGTKKDYNNALNGIDFMIFCFQKLRLGEEGKKVAVLSAFDKMVRNYYIPEDILDKVEIISKNDGDLIKKLYNFLEERK